MFVANVRVANKKLEKDIYRFVTDSVYESLIAVRGVGYPDDELVGIFSEIANRAAHSLIGYFWLGDIRVCCNGKKFTVNGKVVFLVKSLIAGWISEYKRGFAAWTSWDNGAAVIVLLTENLYLDSSNKWCLGDITVRILLFDGYNAVIVADDEVMTVDIITLLAGLANYGFVATL